MGLLYLYLIRLYGRFLKHTGIYLQLLLSGTYYVNPLKPNDFKRRRIAQLTSRCCILYIQQIYVLNILNMLHNLCFFLFKMPFIS